MSDRFIVEHRRWGTSDGIKVGPELEERAWVSAEWHGAGVIAGFLLLAIVSAVELRHRELFGVAAIGCVLLAPVVGLTVTGRAYLRDLNRIVSEREAMDSRRG